MTQGPPADCPPAAEDSADIFDSSLSLLFDLPPFALSPEQDGYCTYRPQPTDGNGDLKPIRLRLAQPPAALHTTLQVNHLWLSGIYLADLLALGDISVRSLRVAELGAGAGLPSIVACREGGAAAVVSTDWGVDEVLCALEDNLGAACSGGKDSVWAVRGHQWGTDPSPLLEALPSPSPVSQTKFDVLLLADVLWATGAHAALLDSIFALLAPDGVAHIAAGLHTGRGPLERFITAAKSRSAHIQPIREVRWKMDGRWEDHEPGQETGLEEERGIVVYFTLRLPSSPSA